jgi:hypothetical protein
MAKKKKISEEAPQATAPKVEKTAPKVETYSKTCENPFHILGVCIDKNFKLDDKNKSNEMFMAKLNHAIKLGLIVKG